VVAVFPVAVLLLVRINALRYQSELITRVQQFGLLLDLSALVWFFHRAPLDASAPLRESRLAEARRWAKLLWLPAIVLGLNLAYMNVVPAGADVDLVRYGQPEAAWEYMTDILRQPLDVVLCPSLRWGCRYLRVELRTSVGHVWDDKAMADLRRGGFGQAQLAAISAHISSIEGLVAYSDDVGRAFRLMSATCSDRSRPAVPTDVGRGGGAPAGIIESRGRSLSGGSPPAIGGSSFKAAVRSRVEGAPTSPRSACASHPG
jgi:hypothetical protein